MSDTWLANVAALLVLIPTLTGIYTMMSPLPAARKHGIDPDRPDGKESYIIIFGARILGFGVALLSLYLMGMAKAMGIVLLSIAIPGMVDIYLATKRGLPGSVTTHTISTMVIGAVGLSLAL